MLKRLNQPLAASADFESALKREPDNGEAHLGLAYANLDLHKPQAAVATGCIGGAGTGDSRDIHVIRATAYGRQNMLTERPVSTKPPEVYPNDGALHLGLGTLISWNGST